MSKYIKNQMQDGISFFMYPVSNLDDGGNVINVAFTSEFLLSVYNTERWSEIKQQRDKKLSATDYTQMPDAQLSDDKKKAWSDYRQALRDLPDSTDNPDDVVWPTKPE